MREEVKSRLMQFVELYAKTHRSKYFVLIDFAVAVIDWFRTNEMGCDVSKNSHLRKDVVSFEVGKLLKEKGYDEPCKGFYSLKESTYGVFKYWEGEGFRHSDFKDWEHDVMVSAPTLQNVLLWLRNRGIVIEIRVRHNTGLGGLPLFEYQWCVYRGLEEILDKSNFFEYHEECVEDAIRNVLEKFLENG